MVFTRQVVELFHKHDFLWQAAGIRCTSVTREDIKFFKDHGCTTIKFGIESGSQAMLDIMEKKFTVEDIKKAVLTSRKHQTTCCVLQLQAASSRSTSTDWLYDYPTGYITDPARRVAVRGSLTAHKSVEPPAQPPHRCLSNAVLYCWTTHVFSSFFLCAIYFYCYQTAIVFSRCPVRTGNRCHHSDPLSTRSVTRPMLHPVVHPAITPCEAPSDAPFPAPCDAPPATLVEL